MEHRWLTRLKIGKRFQNLASGSQLALRTAAAAGVSVGLARQCGLAYPIYALLAAVIVTDLSPSETRKRGVARLIATVAGAAWGAIVSRTFEPSAIVVGTSILVAMLICHLMHADESAKVAGYISGIVIVAHGTNPWAYALLRLAETMLGTVVAWTVSSVPIFIRIENQETESQVNQHDVPTAAKKDRWTGEPH